jgi:hypothetical protein
LGRPQIRWLIVERLAKACYGSTGPRREPEAASMKWVSILVVTAIAVGALWRYGFIEQVLGPWAAWAKWVGYFQ